MIKYQRNLDGFTLYEILIAMVLSMLFIGLCYSILTLTLKMERHLQVQENNTHQKNRLLVKVKQNFFNSEKITHDYPGFIIVSDSLEMEFANSFVVIHKSLESDTIRFNSEEIKLLLESVDNIELIKKMKLSCFTGHETPLVYHFRKDYPAKTLYDQNNGNYGIDDK
jgi:c-di-AMP phosphodiesterase-like protein